MSSLSWTGNMSHYINSSGVPINISEDNFVGYFGAAIIILILVIGAVGNMVVLVSIVRFKKLQQADNILIASLATTDLTFNILIMPFYVDTYINQRWRYSHVLCMMETFAGTLMVMSSAYHIADIAILRYFHVVHQTTIYKQVSTKRSVALQILAIWCLCLLIILPGVLGWEAEVGYSRQIGRCNYIRGSSKGSLCLIFVLGFIMPCVTMVSFYTLIVKKLERSIWKINSYNEKRRRPREAGEMGALLGEVGIDGDSSHPTSLSQARKRPLSDECRANKPVNESALESTGRGSVVRGRRALGEEENKLNRPLSSCQNNSVNVDTDLYRDQELGEIRREEGHEREQGLVNDRGTDAIDFVGSDEKLVACANHIQVNVILNHPPSTEECMSAAGDQINSTSLINHSQDKPTVSKTTDLSTTDLWGAKQTKTNQTGISPLVNQNVCRAQSRDQLPDESGAINPHERSSPHPLVPDPVNPGSQVPNPVNGITAPLSGILSHSHHRHHVKSVRMILVIFVAFVCTYLPFAIINLVDGGSSLRREWYMISSLAFWAGACVNPIIYGLMNSQFLDAYRHLLCVWRNRRTRLGTTW